MREPQRRFQAFFVGKANYFCTKTIFFVDSLAPYVHFHKENGFTFSNWSNSLNLGRTALSHRRWRFFASQRGGSQWKKMTGKKSSPMHPRLYELIEGLLGRRLTSFDRPGTSMGFQGRLLKLRVGLGLHLELCFLFSSFRENSSLSTSLAIQLKPFRF